MKNVSTALQKAKSDVVETYVPPLPEVLRKRHEQRRKIEEELNLSRTHIESEASYALKASRDDLMIHFQTALSGGLFPDTRMSDIVRAWIWNTYKGRFGLGMYRERHEETMIKIIVR